MPEKIVTIARFTNQVEAALARNRLENAGIRAFLNNEESAVMAWQLSSSGTIELLVSEADMETAREALLYDPLPEILAQERTVEHHPEGIAEPDFRRLHRTGIITPETIEEEDDGPPPDTHGEKIDRAFRAALVGCFFFPFQLYTVYLLWGILLDPRPVPPSRQLKFWAAILICLFVFILVWLAVTHVGSVLF